MNSLQPQVAIEERYLRRYVRRLVEYRVSFSIQPVFVVTFDREVDVVAVANVKTGKTIASIRSLTLPPAGHMLFQRSSIARCREP